MALPCWIILSFLTSQIFSEVRFKIFLWRLWKLNSTLNIRNLSIILVLRLIFFKLLHILNLIPLRKHPKQFLLLFQIPFSGRKLVKFILESNRWLRSLSLINNLKHFFRLYIWPGRKVLVAPIVRLTVLAHSRVDIRRTYFVLDHPVRGHRTLLSSFLSWRDHLWLKLSLLV